MDLNALDGNILPAERPHKTSQGSNPPDTSGLCLLDAAPGSTLTTYNATTFAVPFSSERGFGVQTATEDSSILATGQPLHNGRTNNDPTSASSWHADTQHQFGRNGFLADQPPDSVRFGSMWQQPPNPSAAGPEDTTVSLVQERLSGRHASQMWPAARPMGAFADMATEPNVIIPTQRLERPDEAAPATTMYTSPMVSSLRPSPFHPSSSGTQEDEARMQRPLFAFAPGQMWPTEPRRAVNWPTASSSWPPPQCVHTATQAAAADEELLDHAHPCSPSVEHQNNSDDWASLRLHNDAALRADSDWQAERALHDVQPLRLAQNVWDHYRISTAAGTSRQPTNQTWPYFQPASCWRPSNMVATDPSCSHGQHLAYPVAPRQPETNNNNAHNSGWHLQQYEHDHAACLVHRLTWYENALATLPLLLENNAVACPSSLLSLPRPLQPSQLTPPTQPTQPQFHRPSAGRAKTFQPMQMVFRERNRWTTSSGSGNSSSHYNIGTGIDTGRNGISGTPDPSPPPLPLGLPSASSYSTTSGGGNVLDPRLPLPPPLSPAEQQFRRLQGISLNYRGDVHNPHNRGDHVPAHCNTALFLTGLPPTATVGDLLRAAARCGPTGRVFAASVTPPDPARGLPHAAAKVAFFTRAQAERLYARIAAGQLVFDGSPAAVTCTWNRDKKPPRRCVQADECRVLRIRGPRAFVNYAALTAYFAQKFRYDLESVRVLPPGPTGDNVTTKDHGEQDEHDQRDEQTMEWRFASFQSQAIAAKMALNQEHRAVRVTYGRDPLEWGEL